MTTIAFKDGLLAADTQITEGTVKYFGHKIEILPDGRVFTGAGDVIDGYNFLEWLQAPTKKIPKLNKGFEAIIIDPEDGSYKKYQKDCIAVVHDDPIFSTGSGWILARAAMLLGLSAKDAVEFAGDVDIHTNKLVDTYDVKTKKLSLVKFPKTRTR